MSTRSLPLSSRSFSPVYRRDYSASATTRTWLVTIKYTYPHEVTVPRVSVELRSTGNVRHWENPKSPLTRAETRASSGDKRFPLSRWREISPNGFPLQTSPPLEDPVCSGFTLAVPSFSFPARCRTGRVKESSFLRGLSRPEESSQ